MRDRERCDTKDLPPNRISHKRCIQYLHTTLRRKRKRKKKRQINCIERETLVKPRFLTAMMLICFLADACPLLCKLSTRQITQTPDNGGSRASLHSCLYGVLNHPIVSVPNQPEIPAFVASVFIRQTMGDAIEKEGEDQVIFEGIIQGEIIP